MYVGKSYAQALSGVVVALLLGFTEGNVKYTTVRACI